ncbi:MAG TPA: hypothetical protein VF541_08535 [Longimicrobium sp.]|jgi:hypothetical protein
MRNLLALVGLIALLFVGWKFRDRIPGPWHREPVVTDVSQAAAESAEAKLARMRRSGDTIHLSGVEFTSYLRYRFQDQLANQLDAPSVQFSGDTLTLNGRLPTDRLPDTRELRAVRDFLPDTADVRLRGQLRSLGPGRAALRIENVSFAKVPVPHDVYPDALKRMGRRDEPGLGADEYPFRLPPGVASARVEGGELVLAPGQ